MMTRWYGVCGGVYVCDDLIRRWGLPQHLIGYNSADYTFIHHVNLKQLQDEQAQENKNRIIAI